MTKGELARYIKDLECKYSEFMATKFANGLSLGHCNLECLEQKAFLAKETIKVLQRFYNDGKLCEGFTTLNGTTFRITKVCTKDPNGAYANIANTYNCYYIFNGAGDYAETMVGVSIAFGATTLVATKPDGTTSTKNYTFDSDASTLTVTELITASAAATITSGTFSFTPNANRTSAEIDLTSASSLAGFNGITAEFNGILTSTATSSSITDDCDWQEYCITEEEALDMYKKTKQILGVKCNCN